MRLPEDLDGLDGLVIPGGESTTMTMLMERMGLLEKVRTAIGAGLPTLGTCAGMIMLSDRIMLMTNGPSARMRLPNASSTACQRRRGTRPR